MLWQWVIHFPGLWVSKSTSTVCLGGTVSLRAFGGFAFITWNVWPCRWNGWNIIDSLMKRIRTR